MKNDKDKDNKKNNSNMSIGNNDNKHWKDIDEIRFNKKTKHPSWVFGRKGYFYKSAGITHSKTTFEKDNIPLVDNPNPNDRDKNGKLRQSYFNSDLQMQRINTYDTLRKPYTMSGKNKKIIRRYFAIKNKLDKTHKE